MVVVLFNAGAQVPVMPLFDVVGNGVNAAPEQIGATAVKVGVTGAVTVTEKFVPGSKHPPAPNAMIPL